MLMEMNMKRNNKGLELVEEDIDSEGDNLTISTLDKEMFRTHNPSRGRKKSCVLSNIFKTYDGSERAVKKLNSLHTRDYFLKMKADPNCRSNSYRYKPKPWLATSTPLIKKG
jgi:hypothetical protein